MEKKSKKVFIPIITILLITAIVAIFLNVKSEVYTQSEKAFMIMESAYEEERELTDEESKQIQNFEGFADEWKREHFALDGSDLTEQEQEEAKLIQTVQWVISTYEDDPEKFHKKYNEAKTLFD